MGLERAILYQGWYINILFIFKEDTFLSFWGNTKQSKTTHHQKRWYYSFLQRKNKWKGTYALERNIITLFSQVKLTFFKSYAKKTCHRFWGIPYHEIYTQKRFWNNKLFFSHCIWHIKNLNDAFGTELPILFQLHLILFWFLFLCWKIY